MLEHPYRYSQRLSLDEIEEIISASLDILRHRGMIIQSEHICSALRRAGAMVDEPSCRVLFPPEMVREYLSLVPDKWTLYARNPERNVHVGGNIMLVVPGYGSPFIADSDGKRRAATMQDLENLVLISYNAPEIDITGGLLVEPNDISLNLRPLEVTHTLVRYSDKPFLGSVYGTDGAKESIEIAKIIFGDIDNKPCVVGLININSPLRLDSQMADALCEYAKASQPIILTPGILMGITAPVTVIGAMVQAYAELIGCVVAAQLLRPSLPVVVGIGGFGSDLRNCGPGFGRPENALGIQLGAEIARRLNIPFRCSAAVTGSRRPDCRSGYERMMTALTAYTAGAHFCLQAAGILDSIKMMSYEQYIIDLEIWAYIKRFAKSIAVNDESLALDVINTNTNGLLDHDHTIKHMRDQLYAPALAVPDNYEDWWTNGGPDVVSQASMRVQEILSDIKKPSIPSDIDQNLRDYIEARRKTLGKAI